MHDRYIYAESVQCLSKPKEDLKLQDCEWPDLGVGSCPQRSKEGIGPAGIGISDGSEPPCGGWESNPGALKCRALSSLLSVCLPACLPACLSVCLRQGLRQSSLDWLQLCRLGWPDVCKLVWPLDSAEIDLPLPLEC